MPYAVTFVAVTHQNSPSTLKSGVLMLNGVRRKKSSFIVVSVLCVHSRVRVHGHQIFVDGAFNGDPHPGNILLTPDGKLGLIDYGQARRS